MTADLISQGVQSYGPRQEFYFFIKVSETPFNQLSLHIKIVGFLVLCGTTVDLGYFGR